jgi:hypothetical protein
VALYLYVCLGAILLYRAAILGEHRFGAVPYGTAAIKALVLAKFVLLGEAARLGERMAPRGLVAAIAQRSILFVALLAGLTLVEEVVVGLVHGEAALASLSAFVTGRWAEIGASSLLLWLVLIPYAATQHLRAAMGEEAWRRLMSGPG